MLCWYSRPWATARAPQSQSLGGLCFRGVSLSRLRTRRCFSEVPPQIPKASPRAKASSRHSETTGHLRQRARPAFPLPPLPGKKSSSARRGERCRQAAAAAQSGSSNSLTATDGRVQGKVACTGSKRSGGLALCRGLLQYPNEAPQGPRRLSLPPCFW